MSRQASLDRLTELLAEQFERELQPEESRELGALLESNPDWSDDDLDLAAAAVDLAYHTSLPAEDAPDYLIDQILHRSQGFFDATGGRPPLQVIDGQGHGRAVAVERQGSSAARIFVTGGGWLAAAAAVLFAVNVSQPPPPVVEPDPPKPPTVAELRQALLQQPGVTRLDWTATKDPLAQGVTGDVVWSEQNQKGYMRFMGLPVNDPTQQVYQLWIFDKGRDDRYPVDGGVFNVEGGSAVVPINARLRVDDATLFAITLEKPGGVVVSSRERLIVLAQDT